MDNLLLFTKEDENILNKYTLISKNSLEEKEYENYVEKYPALENEDLYIVNDMSKEERENLNNLMAKPLLVFSNINNEETAEKIKQQLYTTQTNSSTINLAQQTNQINVIDIIKNMPEEKLDQILEKVQEQVNQMNESIISQAAIVQVKNEYKQIGMDTDKIQNDYIFMAGLQMLGVAFISMVSAIIVMLLSARVAAMLGRTLRDKVFKKVMGFSTKEFREYSTASLITRSTNDIAQIQNLITMLFRVVVYAPIIGIGGVFHVMNNSDNSMAWIIALAVGAIIVIVLALFSVAMPKFKKLQDLIDRLNLVSREILTGLPVIRAFNTHKREEERFDDSNKDLMKANIFVNRAMSIMMPALSFIMNSIMLLIVWVGGHKVDEGVMQVGDMMAFI